MGIRPAATVVVARSRPDRGQGAGPGIEVLVLRRSRSSRFAPGFVVFPGGAVEAGDAVLARRWFGSDQEVERACALRELAEETGLVLTGQGLVEAPGHLPGDPGLSPPLVHDLPEMARWVAPAFLPVRFDARFFSAASPPGLCPRPDGVEVDRAWWEAPARLLDGQRDGDLSLMWPTLKTLEALTACATVQDVLDLRVAQAPPPAGA
jgi:recombination protein RecT